MTLDLIKREKAQLLLNELISLNDHLCSAEDLELTRELVEAYEMGLALEEFVAMWRVTNKPPLCKRSLELIGEYALMRGEDIKKYLPDG